MMDGPEANTPGTCEDSKRQYTNDVRSSAIFILIKGSSMIIGAYFFMNDHTLEGVVLGAAGVFFMGCGIAGLLDSRS
jgi:hypothetical protein